MNRTEAIGYAIFAIYLIGFIVMSATTAQRLGRSVWLFGRGRESQTMTALLFRLAFAGTAAWPLMRAVSVDPLRIDPVRTHVDGLVADAFGFAFLVIGACIALLSQAYMRDAWRIGAAEGEIGQLVTEGPFEYSRNPVFVGQVILFLGLLLVFPGVVQAAFTLAVFAAIILQVRIEERVLGGALGETYQTYQRRVNRWIGKCAG